MTLARRRWRKGNQNCNPQGEREQDRQQLPDRMLQRRQPDRMPLKCSQTLQMFD